MKRIGTVGFAIAALGTIFFAPPAYAQLVVESIVPSTGEVGASLPITITGSVDASFSESDTVVFSPATNITHGAITLVDYNVIKTTITIPAATTPGKQTVTVSSADISYPGVDLFEVTCSNCGAATITKVEPSSGYPGNILNVTVTGQNTHFSSSSVVTLSNPDLQVGQVKVNQATELVVAITIGTNASPAKSSVTVTTGQETATGKDLFSILPKPITLIPSTAAQGTNLATITITGGPGGYSTQTGADLGEGISIGSITSPDSATLVLNNVSIANDAPVGPHTLTLTLGSGNQAYPNAFTVTPGANTSLISIDPNHGDRGHPGLSVTITAQNARFDRVTPKISDPAGSITAGSITVVDKDHLTATLAIAGSATEGPTNVIVSLCNNVGSGQSCFDLILTNGFTITPPGTLDSADPAIIKAGENVAVAIAATDGNFVSGKTTLILLPDTGLTVASIGIVDSNHLSAQIQADTKPPSGPRSVFAVTDTEVAFGSHILTVYSPQILTVTPPGASVGTPQVTVRITGADIPFDASTQVSFSGTGVSVSAVAFSSSKPNQVIAKVTVDATAALGPRDVIVNAGTLQVTDPKAFAVLSKSTDGGSTGGCSCGHAGSIPLLLLLLLLLPLGLRRRGPPPSAVPRRRP